MINFKSKKCTILGYLPQEDENHSHCVAIKEKLRTEIETLIKEGYSTFYCGLELGIEMWAAEIILDLKKNHSDLRLIPFLADERRADNWSEEHRERYFDEILPYCEPAIYSEYQPEHDSMVKRDKLMIQRSKALLVFTNGTILELRVANSIHYAKEQNSVVIPVDTLALDTDK